jgi:hypothetical protein
VKGKFRVLPEKIATRSNFVFELHTVADKEDDVFGASPLSRGLAVNHPCAEGNGYQEENEYDFCDAFFLHDSLLLSMKWLIRMCFRKRMQNGSPMLD